MLSDARYEAALPCSNLDRAKSFYADRLGLTPADEQPAGALYSGRDGTRFLLFPSSGAASGSHTQMAFRVTDIESEVRDLQRRGVTFEEYETPKTVDGIATIPIGRTAWFRDPDGNLIGMIQFNT